MDLVACRKHKSFGHWGPCGSLQQILPIVPASLYHIHLSTTEKAIVLFFMTLALMQPYIPYNWSIFPLFSISCFPACSELFMLRWHWLVNVDYDHRFDFCDACDEPNYRRAQRAMQEQAMHHREHITRVPPLLTRVSRITRTMTGRMVCPGAASTNCAMTRSRLGRIPSMVQKICR
jgi:hypothetical protein